MSYLSSCMAEKAREFLHVLRRKKTRKGRDVLLNTDDDESTMY